MGLWSKVTNLLGQASPPAEAPPPSTVSPDPVTSLDSLVWRPKSVKDHLEVALRQPWFGAITTLVGAISAFVGSIYATPELKGSFPFTLVVVAPVVVIVFWLSLFLFGLLFFGTLWAQLRANTRSEERLILSEAQLHLGVLDLQALPPVGFLHDFQDILRVYIEAAKAALRDDKLTREKVAQTVRAVLSGVLTLTIKFHRERPADAGRYGVNIMVFRPMKSLSAEDQAAVKPCLMFWEPHFDLTHFLGVLQLDPALSTTSETPNKTNPDPDPDFKTHPFALAVPHTAGDSERREERAVLPGAPWTLLTGKPIVFRDASDLLIDAGRGNFTPNQIQMIRQYTATELGRKVRSFICIPIPAANLAPKEMALGVLNIHRDRNGIFPGKQAELFPPLMLPFCVILSELLARYDSLEPVEPVTFPAAAQPPAEAAATDSPPAT